MQKDTFNIIKWLVIIFVACGICFGACQITQTASRKSRFPYQPIEKPYKID